MIFHITATGTISFNILEQLENARETVSYDIIQNIKAQGNFHISDKNNIIAGLEYNHESLYSVRNEGGLKGDGEAVLYVQEDVLLGKKWSIVAGIRASSHSSYGFNAAPKISHFIQAGSHEHQSISGNRISFSVAEGAIHEF